MRWILGTAGAVAIVAAVATAVWVVQRGSQSHSTVIGGSSAPARVGGPLLRDPRSLMVAARAGDVLIGVAAVPGRAELTVVPGDTGHIPIGDVRVAVGGHAVRPSRCGRACFGVDAPFLLGAPTALSVDVRRAGRSPDLAVIRIPARLPQPARATLAGSSRSAPLASGSSSSSATRRR